MRKATFASRSGSIKTMLCKECKSQVHNVDEKTISVTCWKCVSKSLNPQSVIISDMNEDELKNFIKKQTQNGGSEN
jgi:NAD-dependent SIR2 family protein deacetylase